MHLSAKKQRDLTFLEVQAQQMVNEELDEDNDYIGGIKETKDDSHYQALLEKKKDRRAVWNYIHFIYILFRENHYLIS